MVALQRQRMSYDEYLALPESVRAEWVDGEVVVTPSASYQHQKISRRLANLIDAALPELYVVEAVTTYLPNNRERIPDIVVVKREPDTLHVHETPVCFWSRSSRPALVVRTRSASPRSISQPA